MQKKSNVVPWVGAFVISSVAFYWSIPLKYILSPITMRALLFGRSCFSSLKSNPSCKAKATVLTAYK